MGPTEDDWTEIIGTFHIIEGHMAHETYHSLRPRTFSKSGIMLQTYYVFKLKLNYPDFFFFFETTVITQVTAYRDFCSIT